MKVGSAVGHASTNGAASDIIAALKSLKLRLVPEVGLEPTSLAAGDFESLLNRVISILSARFVPRTYRKRITKVGTALSREPAPRPGACAAQIGEMR